MNEQPTIEGLDPGEKQLNKIHRSSVPLVATYLGILIGLVILALMLKILLPSATLYQNRVNQYDAIAVGGLAILAIIGMEIFTFVFRGNYLILTDKKFTQVLRKGLFSRQVSELSWVDVEDVTALKNGFFQTIFNYGTLRVETAGEMENFDFKICPNPDYFGKVVLDARQQFLNSGGDTHA